mmetsp:Transcript_2148/g.5451  ORF Transcript_2148/g.5451 Transcript_2148/m.5451 type:complete len:215 (-) Transcript_2148:240-884(-)
MDCRAQCNNNTPGLPSPPSHQLATAPAAATTSCALAAAQPTQASLRRPVVVRVARWWLLLLRAWWPIASWGWCLPWVGCRRGPRLPVLRWRRVVRCRWVAMRPRRGIPRRGLVVGLVARRGPTIDWLCRWLVLRRCVVVLGRGWATWVGCRGACWRGCVARWWWLVVAGPSRWVLVGARVGCRWGSVWLGARTCSMRGSLPRVGRRRMCSRGRP